MKIGILLLGLAASVATALPARNQTGTLSSFAKNSTHWGPVYMDVTLEWANRKFYYKDPSYVRKLQIGYDDWDVEYWDCVPY
ncbi:hypothetical protein EC957_008952 [Mortierella hygrophila]|uniref:Uncharacterized protein n=1 Tax=Mortierella hygrophila TaxID=979708 RepID=A0A9P6FAW4_9FUNG|nr:hypothetical protein EC957_008952 [Mortierella hygrophila]